MPPAPDPLDALHLSDAEFGQVAKLAYDRFGLSIPESKRDMVSNRLTRLARKKGIGTLGELIATVGESASVEDMLGFFDVLSTNLTNFFRESVHFELLQEHLLEPMREAAERGGPRKLRIWSAGCSSGCEPFTLGILLHEVFPDLSKWDARILATDLAETEVGKAQAALYPVSYEKGVPRDYLDKYFSKTSLNGKPAIKVKDSVRRLVTIGLLNLMGHWPMKGPFDAIFCRNVMIYFDLDTREKLIRRFTQLIAPGGLLFIGCSENLSGEHPLLERIGPSAYRKSGDQKR